MNLTCHIYNQRKQSVASAAPVSLFFVAQNFEINPQKPNSTTNTNYFKEAGCGETVKCAANYLKYKNSNKQNTKLKPI